MRGLFVDACLVSVMAAVTVAMAAVAMVVPMVMAVVAMMMVVMFPSMVMVVVRTVVGTVVHRRDDRSRVVHRCRITVVHRRLVIVNRAGKVAIAKSHGTADTRVGTGDLCAQQAADEQGCTDNLLHDFLHAGFGPMQLETPL